MTCKNYGSKKIKMCLVSEHKGKQFSTYMCLLSLQAVQVGLQPPTGDHLSVSPVFNDGFT